MKVSLVKLTYVDPDGSETVLSFEPHQELELVRVLNQLFTENRLYVATASNRVPTNSRYQLIRGINNG